MDDTTTQRFVIGSARRSTLRRVLQQMIACVKLGLSHRVTCFVLSVSDDGPAGTDANRFLEGEFFFGRNETPLNKITCVQSPLVPLNSDRELTETTQCQLVFLNEEATGMARDVLEPRDVPLGRSPEQVMDACSSCRAFKSSVVRCPFPEFFGVAYTGLATAHAAPRMDVATSQTSPQKLREPQRSEPNLMAEVE